MAFTTTTEQHAGCTIYHYSDGHADHITARCPLCDYELISYSLAEMREMLVWHLEHNCGKGVSA